MGEGVKTLKEGIVLGLEFAEAMLESASIELAIGSINDRKMKLLAEIEDSEQKSEKQS